MRFVLYSGSLQGNVPVAEAETTTDLASRDLIQIVTDNMAKTHRDVQAAYDLEGRALSAYEEAKAQRIEAEKMACKAVEAFNTIQGFFDDEESCEEE